MATYSLPALTYDFDAFEPVIDRQTMEIHHDKHHQAYVNKLNAALEGHTELQEKSLEELLADLDSVPDSIRSAVRNNGGGHLNHTLFWEILTAPSEDNAPSGKLAEAIDSKFGSFENFKSAFSDAAANRFGSGWAWLIVTEDGGVDVTSTLNQDNPIQNGQTAILGIDVWEHAYYLNYQNRRPDYVSNFFKVINWPAVAEKYENARG